MLSVLQVRWHVRAAVMRPALWFPGSVAGTKWKLEEAAAAVTGVTLAPEEEPVKPQVRSVLTLVHFLQHVYVH